MTTKGTSVWEQYVEHVVLAIAIIVMAWFAWSAFGTKIESRVGRRTLTTATVDGELLQAAIELAPNFEDGEPSPLEITLPDPLGNRFTARLSQSISPSQRVVFPRVDLTSEIDVNQNVVSELRMYVQPNISAPEDIRMHQWFGTVAQSEMNRVDELSESIDGPPNDTSWIQIAAKFDVDSVMESFSLSSDDAEPIPGQWYNNGIDIFDVVIERQTLLENEWSAPEVVDVLPGHLTYRSKLAEGSVDSMEMDSIISNLRGGSQAEITTPDFYPLKGISPKNTGAPWSWDGFTQIEDFNEEEDGTAEVKKSISRIEGRISKQEKLINRIIENIDDAQRGGGGRGPMGGGGGGAGDKEKKLDRLQKQLERAEEKLSEYHEEKKVLEEDLAAIEQGQEVVEAGMGGDVWVWGHDLTAQTGEKYRYRMTIQLANPFFGHKPSLFPQQVSLAKDVTVASETSKWTDVIEMQKSKQWFVTGSKKSGGGIARDRFNPGHISVELFEFSDGSWNNNSLTIQVGQPIGSPDGSDAEWFVLDVWDDTVGDVVWLQHLVSGEKKIYRPELEANSYKLRQLELQASQEEDLPMDDDEEDSDNPMPKPGGPMGGGGGGPF